jgi:hypothetical protein
LIFSQNTNAGKVKYDYVYNSIGNEKNMIVAQLSFNPELAIEEIVRVFGNYKSIKTTKYSLNEKEQDSKKVWVNGGQWFEKKPFRKTYFWDNVIYRKWSKNKFNLEIEAAALPILTIIDDDGNQIINNEGLTKGLAFTCLNVYITDINQNDVLESEYTKSKVISFLKKINYKTKRIQRRKTNSIN